MCDSHKSALLTCAEIDSLLRAETALTPSPQGAAPSSAAAPTDLCCSLLACPARPARSATSKLFFGDWDRTAVLQLWRDLVLLCSLVTKLHPLAASIKAAQRTPIGAAASTGSDVVRSSLLSCVSSAAWADLASPLKRRRGGRAAPVAGSATAPVRRSQLAVLLLEVPLCEAQWVQWGGGAQHPRGGGGAGRDYRKIIRVCHTR